MAPKRVVKKTRAPTEKAPLLLKWRNIYRVSHSSTKLETRFRVQKPGRQKGVQKWRRVLANLAVLLCSLSLWARLCHMKHIRNISETFWNFLKHVRNTSEAFWNCLKHFLALQVSGRHSGGALLLHEEQRQGFINMLDCWQRLRAMLKKVRARILFQNVRQISLQAAHVRWTARRIPGI